MKAYKAFDPMYNAAGNLCLKKGKCKNMEYTEGETYTYEGNISLCSAGFHFCKDLVLTLQYYPNIYNNRYAEVEILGDTIFEELTKHKGVTNRIKIIKFITKKELKLLLDDNSNSGARNSGYRNSGDSNSGNWNSGISNSGDSNSGNWNSGNWNSGNNNSGNWNSGISNSGIRNSGISNSGNRNSGDSNSGYRNSGNSNSGNDNSGNDNSGIRNSGNDNSGNRNSGNRNSGNRNSGNRNSGDSNSGNWNSGNNNSGNWNSGNWNSGNSNSGYFNSNAPVYIRVFNKLIHVNLWNAYPKPKFLSFQLDPELTYKENFIKSWESADKEDRIRIKDCPGFDAAIFYEITGIDLREKQDESNM